MIFVLDSGRRFALRTSRTDVQVRGGLFPGGMEREYGTVDRRVLELRRGQV